MNDRKIILYIATSLDGYIADGNGNISFLSLVENPPEDYGYKEFVDSIDTVIMGRKTYDKILSFGIEFPHKNKKCFVISKSKTGSNQNVDFYNGNLNELIERIRKNPGKNIYCDGGAEMVHELMKVQLIDQYIISIIPILLGNGTHLFKSGFMQQELNLRKTLSYPSGLVQLWSDRILN